MFPQMVIVFPLTTSVTISSFPTPLPTAFGSFVPVYNARPDGSLMTSQYMREVYETNIRMFIIGFLLMLFTRNAIVAINYLYRSRSKDKTLFYLLIASQILGPVCFISLAVSLLSFTAHCSVVYTIALVCIAVSQSVLVTGILGIKAYRCLDRSRIVLSVISILQVASSAIMFYDVSRLRSYRLASGSCEVTTSAGNFTFFPICILLLFMQSLFICLCFVYTVWRASAYSAAQGRLSLAVSLETVGDERARSVSPEAEAPESRGWWDYVPQPQNAPAVQKVSNTDNHPVGNVSRLFGLIAEPVNPVPERKPSIPSEKPLPQPYPPTRRPRQEHHISAPRVTSSTLSLQQRWVSRLYRMRFVRVAMRDELVHAATVALNSIVTVVLIGISLTSDIPCGPFIWLGINWMVTSIVVMHSFSRVVKRHEREAILREPNTWEAIARRETRRRAPSPISIASHRRPRRVVEHAPRSPTHSHSWSDPFRSHEDVERATSPERTHSGFTEVWEAEPSSPPPTPAPDFLPNHYPERTVPRPLESPIS